MRIELKGLPAIEVESGDNPKGHELVERVLASDGIEAVIEEIAKSSYYSAYATWDSMEKSTAKDIAEALFDGGVTAAEDKVIEIVDSGGSAAHEEYRQMMAPRGHGNTKNLDIIAEAIAEACDEFVSGIREALVEGLQDPVIEAFQDADESNVLDVVPDHVRVEVIYFFGLEGGAFDDHYTQNESNVSNLGTIRPDENLAAAFTGFNLPIAAFREAVKAKYGFDMAAGSKVPCAGATGVSSSSTRYQRFHSSGRCGLSAVARSRAAKSLSFCEPTAFPNRYSRALQGSMTAAESAKLK